MIKEIAAAFVRQVHESAASYITLAFGMTLQDRQRAYYDNLDKHFPGTRQRYAQTFADRYFAPARNVRQLEAHFMNLCRQYGILTRMPQNKPITAEQLSLF